MKLWHTEPSITLVLHIVNIRILRVGPAVKHATTIKHFKMFLEYNSLEKKYSAT